MSQIHVSGIKWGPQVLWAVSHGKENPGTLGGLPYGGNRGIGFISPSGPILPLRNRSAFITSLQDGLHHRKRCHKPPQRVCGTLAMFDGAVSSLGEALLLNTPLFLAGRQSQQRMLTPAGLRHAYALGLLLWTTLSWRGYSLCFLFLIIGSAVTRLGKEKKEALGIAEKRDGARGPENLWGAAGVAAILAVCAFLARGAGALELERFAVMGYAGALAAKFSDTAGSEIGKAYGSKTYRLGSWEQVTAGVEGGVSVEGTFASIVGAGLAAGVAWAVGLVNGGSDFVIIWIAGVVASTAESAFGGRFQDELQLSNEAVNAVNTFCGAVVGMGLHGLRLWLG